MVTIDGRIPQRGDVLKLQLSPSSGSEQTGFRPVIVISPQAYNQISRLILICPITSKVKGWPFEVRLPSTMQTYGVILCDQLRIVDPIARNASFVESVSRELIDEITAKLRTLIL